VEKVIGARFDKIAHVHGDESHFWSVFAGLMVVVSSDQKVTSVWFASFRQIRLVGFATLASHHIVDIPSASPGFISRSLFKFGHGNESLKAEAHCRAIPSQ
jgi:hypothetical protein